jgi:hypothetical protein
MERERERDAAQPTVPSAMGRRKSACHETLRPMPPTPMALAWAMLLVLWTYRLLPFPRR